MCLKGEIQDCVAVITWCKQCRVSVLGRWAETAGEDAELSWSCQLSEISDLYGQEWRERFRKKSTLEMSLQVWYIHQETLSLVWKVELENANTTEVYMQKFWCRQIQGLSFCLKSEWFFHLAMWAAQPHIKERRTQPLQGRAVIKAIGGWIKIRFYIVQLSLLWCLFWPTLRLSH